VVVGPNSEVWQEGTPDWVVASRVPVLFPNDRIKAKEVASRPSTIPEAAPASNEQEPSFSSERKTSASPANPPGGKIRKPLVVGAVVLSILVLVGIGVALMMLG
jgi:hypothetical protein